MLKMNLNSNLTAVLNLSITTQVAGYLYGSKQAKKVVLWLQCRIRAEVIIRVSNSNQHIS